MNVRQKMALFIFVGCCVWSFVLKASNPSDIFHVFEEKGQWFFDIPKKLMGREIMVINRALESTSTGYLPDDQIGGTGSKTLLLFKWSPQDHNVTVHVDPAEYAMNGQCTRPLPNIYYRSNGLPELVQLSAYPSPQNEEYIRMDVTEWLKGGKGFVEGTADNIVLLQTNLNSFLLKSHRIMDKKELWVSTLFYLLPEIPMKPRILNNRVGYFKSEQQVLAANGADFVNKQWICRWRLEPRSKDVKAYFKGKLVTPKEPIIFYIDPLIPKQWIPYVKKAVDSWKGALEQAGFKNAIEAREAPKGDPNWCLSACRAAISYKASETENAFGPVIYDSRSGEIIQTHISLYYNMNSWVWRNYLIQASPSDPSARTPEFSEALVGRLLQDVLTHEVGHALGLSHNFGSSSVTPVENLRDNSWLDANGLTSSIMDYSRYNYVAQPGDHVLSRNMTKRIGIYDKWAIEYGYKVLPDFKNEEEELQYLDQWVATKNHDRRRWWGDGEKGSGAIVDPHTQSEDIGDDPIKASEYGIKNLQYVVGHLGDWKVDKDPDLKKLTAIVNSLLSQTDKHVPSGQFSLYVGHVNRLIGGIYLDGGYTEEWKPLKTYVPRFRQKQAVYFLNQYLFTNQDWLIKNRFVKKSGVDMIANFLNIQTVTLDVLFRNLDRIYWSEMASNDPYPIRELMRDLGEGVWGKRTDILPLNPMRKQLQFNYLRIFKNKIKNTSTDYAIVAELLYYLDLLKSDLTRKLVTNTNRWDKLHYQAVLNTIVNMTSPKEKSTNTPQL
ncbi:protein of unknown function [bacterium A37T11]|nr:protein of unknown function [bacterium A37T11]